MVVSKEKTMQTEESLSVDESRNIAADVEAIMKKYDRESNVRTFVGIPRYILRYALALFAIYCVYINIFANWETRIERASFVGCVVFFIFVFYPATKKGEMKPNYIPWYDILLGLAGAFTYFYFVANCREIIAQGIKLNTFEMVLGIIGIIITMEACRRSVGIPIVVVAMAFLAYAMTQKSLRLNVYNLFFTADGVIGTPTRACSTFIVLFVLFGSFLEKTGISDFFIQFANSICGRSTGGPAKAAVIASALEGVASGSSVANTVGSGSITIPMMKKLGYNKEFAGAVEAAASTGGQIMPPIMGAAAFLMAEYSSYQYSSIALRAILPAVLYFMGIFLMVHLEAKKLGLRGIPKDQIPNFWKLMLRNGYLLIPLVALVALISKITITYAAVIATIIAIVISMFRKDTRITFTKFVDALENGAKNVLTVGVACAIAGIVACVITTTGIGSKLITLIVGASGGMPIIALFLTMITCIVLGMGVPTTANYVIMATTCAPILIQMDIAPLAAHMFVFYFGIVADITPPVALAAYAGAAIAKADPMKTGVTATKLAIAAFIIPYVFALSPAMLFIDTEWYEVVQIVVTSIIGMYGVAMGLEGFCVKHINILFRILSVLAGLLLIYPGLITDIIGIVVIGGIVLFQYLGEKSVKAESAA